MDGTPKARVFAYTDEIDRWLAEKRGSAGVLLEATEESPRQRTRKTVVLASAVIILAAITILGWRLILRKPISPQLQEKTSLTGQIKPGSGLESTQIPQSREIDLGPVTSRNIEALKLYLEGCKMLLGFRDSELWRRARSHFSKAIEIEPGFAMAYCALASTYSAGEDQTKNLKKALELSDQVSPRERLIIRGNYYSSVDKNNEKAIQAYKKALKIYPNDELANETIANLYMRIRDYQNAYKHREILYEKDKTSRFRLIEYTSICMILNFFDKIIEAYKYYLAYAPEDLDMRRRLYNFYWQAGKYELALNEADRLRASGVTNVERIFPLYLMGNYLAAEQLCKDLARRPGSVWAARDWLQNIYITQGQLEKAKEQVILGLQEEYKLAEAGRVTEGHGRFVLHLRLAELYLIEGKLEDAMDAADKAGVVASDFKHEPYQLDAATAKAEIYLKMKFFDKAYDVAEGIREIVKSETEDEMRFYYFIAGKIELAKGDLPKAVDYLERTRALDDLSPDYIATLASAYYQAGKLRAARKECEKIPLITRRRALRGYVYAMNFYTLGKICEGQRNRAKAVEYYGKFLDLWKGADPVLHEVEDAKTRLARLVSH